MNALVLLRNDLSRHKVKVTLPREKVERDLCLIIVTANTSIIEDIEASYLEINKTQQKMLLKLFGRRDDQRKNRYGVFLEENNLSYVYAFNLAFSKYDKKSRTVVFKNLDDFLIANLSTQASSKPSPNYDGLLEGVIESLQADKRTEEYYDRDDSGVLFKYATAEKGVQG